MKSKITTQLAVLYQNQSRTDVPEREASSTREETPVDRRMTLIPEETEPGRTVFTFHLNYNTLNLLFSDKNLNFHHSKL